MNRRCLCFILILCSPTSAHLALGGVITESTANSTFATREIVASGTRIVNGDLTQFDTSQVDFSFSGSLLPNQVDFYSTITAPGRSYVSWTDSNGGFLDTVLGSFGTAGDANSIIDIDDDNSPAGFPFSGLNGTANPDGSINLGVTGYPDMDFSGQHNESGAYFLNIQYDATLGDVDFYQFSDLAPGSLFAAEITAGDFDSVLGWFDDRGTPIDIDDDGGDDALSRLFGTVPKSGNLILGVSGFPDFDFNGNHPESGGYVLEVDAERTLVPEPSSLAIFALIGLCVTGVNRRRQPRMMASRERE